MLTRALCAVLLLVLLLLALAPHSHDEGGECSLCALMRIFGASLAACAIARFCAALTDGRGVRLAYFAARASSQTPVELRVKLSD